MLHEVLKFLSRSWKEIIWIIISFIVSFVLSSYVWPDVVVVKSALGLKKEVITHFNLPLFIFFILISIALLFIAELLFFRKKIILSKDQYHKLFYKNKVLIFILALAAVSLYVIGLISPLYRSEHFFFFVNEVSLVNSVKLLFEYEEYYLAILIFLFTILFPVFKFFLIFLNIFSQRRLSGGRVNHLLANISKWSMLDVFIVAVLLLNMKFDSRIIDMELRNGIIWFSLSIVLVIFIMIILGRVEISDKSNDPG